MASNGEKQWHYLEVKKSSGLLREITSTYHGDFYCLNFLHSFVIVNRIKKYVITKIFVMQLYLLKPIKYYNLINIKNLIKHNLLFMRALNL